MSDSQMANKQAITYFTHALKAFSASNDALRVLCTVPRTSSPAPAPTPPSAVKTLIILDSSFNPPTTAHAQMASSAVDAAGPNTRLMLLLAVKNADKGVAPAAFETRLCMMEAFARELLRESANNGNDGEAGLAIDVAVTTMPYFHDKAAAIARVDGYQAARQVFLCGFDTVVRIFDAKYYAGSGGMKRSLGPFFDRASLRVTMRDGGQWGGKEEQRAYVDGLGARLRDGGGDGAWAGRIELADGLEGDVSSSRAREVVGSGDGDGDGDGLEGLVGGEVRMWIEGEGLYR